MDGLPIDLTSTHMELNSQHSFGQPPHDEPLLVGGLGHDPRGLHAFPHEGDGVDVDHVHVFHADGAAVHLLQSRYYFPK